jgi:phosphoketolase
LADSFDPKGNPMNAPSPISDTTLSADELDQINAYWRACNYLAAGMIFLRDNPLLREPLQPEHVKRRLLGHWGASPGLSFAWVHLNRLINKYDLDTIFMAGPGHGAPGILAPVYLEGFYSEVYPNKSEDMEGMRQSSRNSPSRAASAAIARRKPPARSMKAANSVTASRTLSAPPMTTRICW